MINPKLILVYGFVFKSKGQELFLFGQCLIRLDMSSLIFSEKYILFEKCHLL